MLFVLYLYFVTILKRLLTSNSFVFPTTIKIGTWTKNIYDATLSQYKVMCTKWMLGTGGGDGRSTMFESWDDKKLNKYNVTKDTYDHTDVQSRPSILVNNYHLSPPLSNDDLSMG